MNTSQYFVKDDDDPYSTPADRPFSWIRVRAVGGKSLLWAGHCYRMSDLDFKAARIDAVGEPWPITYEEICPYYDKAERILQVQDAENERPDRADIHAGREAVASHLQRAFATKGYRLVPARVSEARIGPGHRQPCRHCGEITGECLRTISSTESTLAAAKKTGLLTLWPQCRVRNVLTDSGRKAIGIAGIRRPAGEQFQVQGRIVFLCASPLESVRILLNSASDAFPRGLGNSSGVLGHYLMDHVSGIVLNAICHGFSQRENSRAGMFYVPRCQNVNGRRSERFLRGFGFQGFILRADHELLPCARTRRVLESNPSSATL